MYTGKRNIYDIRNIDKTKGKSRIILRSMLERKVAIFLDNNDRVTRWDYEAVRIPYRWRGRTYNYTPDFVYEWKDGEGTKKCGVCEVKSQQFNPLNPNNVKGEETQRNRTKYLAAYSFFASKGVLFKCFDERTSINLLLS